jgi:hypothetical protein
MFYYISYFNNLLYKGRVLAGKPEGQRQLGRPRRRWEDNIKMDHEKIR